MRRRALALGLALGLLATPLPAGAQQTKKARIDLLGTTPMVVGNMETFRQGLGEMGYAEGTLLAIADKNAGGDPVRLAAVVDELLRSAPDVILARGPQAMAAAARATKTIPIVAVDLESDPVALGYAKTLARPGGNVTGIFLDLPDLSAKQLQIFREVVPRLARVALIGDATHNAAQIRAAERAAHILGVQTQLFEGRTAAELEAALEAARQSRAGAVLLFSSPTVFAGSARLAALAREKRLPAGSLFTEFAEAGGLLTYGPSVRDAFRRCGVYVAKILSGAKPGELPIEAPDRFELAINVRAAKALGLTIPRPLLQRADRVLE